MLLEFEPGESKLVACESDSQFAEIMIVSVPEALGGAITAYVFMPLWCFTGTFRTLVQDLFIYAYRKSGGICILLRVCGDVEFAELVDQII